MLIRLRSPLKRGLITVGIARIMAQAKKMRLAVQVQALDTVEHRMISMDVAVFDEGQPSAYVYCHQCCNLARFKFRTGESLELEPTGTKGSAEQLKTEVDEALLSAPASRAICHPAPNARRAGVGKYWNNCPNREIAV